MSKKIRTFILSVVNYRDGSEKQVLLLEGRLQPVLYFPIYKKKTNRPLIPSYYHIPNVRLFRYYHQHNKDTNNN